MHNSIPHPICCMNLSYLKSRPHLILGNLELFIYLLCCEVIHWPNVFGPSKKLEVRLVPYSLPWKHKTIWHNLFHLKGILWIQNRHHLPCQLHHDLWWNQLIKAGIKWKNICSVTETNLPEERASGKLHLAYILVTRMSNNSSHT